MKAFSQFVREAYAVLDSTRFERRTPTFSELEAASVKPPKEDYILEAALPPPGTTSGAVTMYKKPQPNISPRTPLTSSRQTQRNFGQDYARQERVLSARAAGGSGLADIRGTQPPRQQPPATQPPRQQPPATQPPRQQRPATQPPRQQRPATGQIVAAAGGKGGTVTVGRQYAATLGGQKGYVTYDATGKKSFTANEPAAKPQPTGKPIAAAPETPAEKPAEKAKPAKIDYGVGEITTIQRQNPALTPKDIERIKQRGKPGDGSAPMTPTFAATPPPKPAGNPSGGTSTQNKTTDPEKKDPRQRRISQKYDIFPFTPRKAEETD